MKTIDLKETYLKFFESKGHKIIPSAPIIPENDPTCLFNTAGMQPLVPYLKGEPHPEGKRLTDVQKCFRTNDLDSIGDTTHHTFFEMLGNWSLGDYFKKESISWSFEFLTKKLEIPVEKLAVTVFKGNDIVPADTESAEIWESLGIKKDKIAFLSEEHNWWPNMEMLGPCGPDTEIFYWRSEEPVPEKFDEENENWVEIWNNVFMQYNHEENGKFTPLKNKNVDTGLGVERVTAILEGYTDNYKSSVWKDVIKKIEEISGLSYENEEYTRSMRIIADHIRAIVIIAGDDAGIKPSNTDQGYILRRLIRRTIRYAKKLNIDINSDWEQQLAELIINKYSKYYGELERNRSDILETLKKATPYIFLQKELQKIQLKIKIGNTIEEAFLSTNLFSSTEIKTISIGEKTGRLSEAFSSISFILQKDLESYLFKLTTLLQPFLLLILGIIIGIIVLAIYLPIFNITDLII